MGKEEISPEIRKYFNNNGNTVYQNLKDVAKRVSRRK